jgi:acyl carrier protein
MMKDAITKEFAQKWIVDTIHLIHEDNRDTVNSISYGSNALLFANDETNIESAGLDSLSALRLVVEIENQFSLEMSNVNDISDSTTIEQLAEIIVGLCADRVS